MPEKRPVRIVIADDEGVIRMGLTSMVRALGHRVVATARDGTEAIEKVLEFEPDLLLLDIKMPGMDGLAVAEHLAEHAPLPVVMLTAFSEYALVERAVNALVMGYLVKPVNESKLSPMIDVAMARFADRTAVAGAATILQKKIAGRDMVSAAKSALMATGLTENEAYLRLQSMARARQTAIETVAAQLLNRAAD